MISEESLLSQIRKYKQIYPTTYQALSMSPLSTTNGERENTMITRKETTIKGALTTIMITGINVTTAEDTTTDVVTMIGSPMTTGDHIMIEEMRKIVIRGLQIIRDKITINVTITILKSDSNTVIVMIKIIIKDTKTRTDRKNTKRILTHTALTAIPRIIGNLTGTSLTETSLTANPIKGILRVRTKHTGRLQAHTEGPTFMEITITNTWKRTALSAIRKRPMITTTTGRGRHLRLPPS